MPKIDSSYFGSIVIDGRKYNTDVIVSWDGEIIEREKSHIFSKKELMDLLMMKDVETIIIGTGTAGSVRIDPEAEVFARVEGITLTALPTSQAIDEFNKRSRRTKVVAVIHVTD